MSVVPAVRPFTTPAVLTVPTAGVLLLHVPAGVLERVTVALIQTVDGPVNAVGRVFTVTVRVARQLETLYVIVAVPPETPVTVPPETVATAILLLLHVPPLVLELNTVVAATHTVCVPVKAAGKPFTVTTTEREQPLGPVVVMFTVPADMPPTTPLLAPTVPTAVLLLLQVALAVVVLRVVVLLTHTVRAPVMASGSARTVTTRVAIQPDGNV